MSYAPVTPRARRDRRGVQSTTPTKRRSNAGLSRLDRLSVSPGGSYSKKSLLLPRTSNPVLPRPVTPSNDNSWEISKDRPGMSIIDRMPSTPPRRSCSSNRSVVSESAAIPFDEDEMPDDEKNDTVHRLSNGHRRLNGLQQPFLSERVEDKPHLKAQLETQKLKKEVHRLNSLLNGAHGHEPHTPGSYRRPPASPVHNVDAADRGGGSGFHHHHHSDPNHDDDVSSLGGVEDCVAPGPSLNRVSLALRSRIDPSELTQDEKGLFEMVQSEVSRGTTDSQNKIRNLEKELNEASEKREEAQSEKRDLEKKLTLVKRDLQASKAKLHVQGEDARKQRSGTSQAVEGMTKKVHELEQKRKEACTQLAEQQTEHDRAIRAIQRVLADVTTQRDEMAEKLQEQIAALEGQKANLLKQDEAVSSSQSAPTSDQDVASLRSRAQRAFVLEREMEELKSSLLTCETARDELKQELEQKGGKIAILEQEVNMAKSSLESSRDREKTLNHRVEEKAAEVETLNRRLETLSSGAVGSSGAVDVKTGDSVNQRELEALREELQEKRTSLETAKNIIASLENASGSLTADLRGKLRDKELQVTSLKGEMADGKRTLDNLATELRDLQLQKKQLALMQKQANNAGVQQREFQKELEKSLSELRSATAIHEAEATDGCLDEDLVEQVSTVLGNLLSSLETSLTSTRALATSTVDVGDVDDNFSDGSLQLPDDTKARIVNLEDALREKGVEVERLTNETEEMRLVWEEEEAKLKVEIRSLQDQCMTNMQVLTKKERELEVLRDSLEVTDGVGYISDDASDAEDEEEAGPLINRTMSIDSSHYSHSQAEAVATLLVQGGTGIEVTSGISAAKFDTLQMEMKKLRSDKEKAARDLKQEQEALSNAKMIISSLERANKTMLEDLRSRLQDSNTAIASLLEKSSEQEKKSSSLRTELEQLTEEKDKETESHKEEVRKLKDEKDLSSLKLAEKEREVADLLQRLHKLEENPPEMPTESEGESAEEAKDGESPKDDQGGEETAKKSPPKPER